ncbi:YegS/Rv2252/BmrU family lipid kinase [Rhodoluna sp.]|uniref:diacylglycerol/lipid kinase family protein n=1 Tax=Rhodoluna sp. TaxID=1969481 RepID=UPI0025E73FF1|nr:YegS/Rv2252/BmrU family lipid kinase [Rhodoluna sp.]
MKRLGVIVNPTAGGGTSRTSGDIAIEELQRGCEVIDLSGETPLQAETNAKQAIEDCIVDGIVVVGGDGTVNLGVNVCAETGVPLGIIAAGTGNDSARTLGLPIGDITSAARSVLINLEEPRTVDAIKGTSSTGEFWFFGSLSAGFDALVNQRANSWTWPTGPSRYQLAMLAELAKFKPIHYEAEIDGKKRSFEAMLCAVANAPGFGGGMMITPDAQIDDGFLDLFIVHKMSRPELIRVFPKVYTGAHVFHPAVEIIRAKQVKISAGQMPTFADGESKGHSPISATVVPGSLKVFASANTRFVA